MKRKILDLILFLGLGPLFPAGAAAANKYMVENTTGTNGCYLFQTVPTCQTTISGLVVSTTTFGNLFNSTNTWTAQQNFTSTVSVIGPFKDSTGSTGVSGQILQTNGVATTWTTSTTGNLTSTQTWSGFNTYTSSSGVQVSTIVFNNNATGGIKGTATNDSAASGIDGEFKSAVAAGINCTNAGVNVTSLLLTPGDWDIAATLNHNGASAAVTFFELHVNTSSGSIAGDTSAISLVYSVGSTSSVGSANIPRLRASLNANTTYYLNVRSAGATDTYDGYLNARRIR